MILVAERLHVGHEGSTLLVVEDRAGGAVADPVAVERLEDGEEGEDEEGERRPVDEGRRGLVDEDGQQRPGYRNGSGDITLRAGEGVGRAGRLKEEEGKEDKDLGPNASLMAERVDAESLETGQEDKHGRPAVVEGERQVDEELIVQALGAVVLLDDVVDVRHGRAHQQGEDERNNVVMALPNSYVDGGEDGQEWVPPGDGIDDDTLAGIEELVNHREEKKQVDDGPDVEGKVLRGEVGLLAGSIARLRTGNGEDVGPEEEERRDDVHDFEEDTVCPSHCC